MALTENSTKRLIVDSTFPSARDSRLEESWMQQAGKVGDWETVLEALELQCDSEPSKT